MQDMCTRHLFSLCLYLHCKSQILVTAAQAVYTDQLLNGIHFLLTPISLWTQWYTILRMFLRSRHPGHTFNCNFGHPRRQRCDVLLCPLLFCSWHIKFYFVEITCLVMLILCYQGHVQCRKHEQCYGFQTEVSFISLNAFPDVFLSQLQHVYTIC